MGSRRITPLASGFVLICLVLLIIAPVQAENCVCDDIAPAVTIASPVSNVQDPQYDYETTQAFVDLAGETSDAQTAITNIVWTNDKAGGDVISASTDWTGPWYWEAKGISLVKGEVNTISVIATDVAGNQGVATLRVLCKEPEIPPPLSVGIFENKKTKFTFYFGGDSYDGLDRFSVVGFLKKESDQEFIMPHNKTVTVTVHVPDPQNPSQQLQIFTETIAPGAAGGSSKYRYTAAGPGIRELLFEVQNSTSIYTYVFVDKYDFMPAIKAAVGSDAEYLALVAGINQYTLTVQIDDIAWSGEAPLFLGTTALHKQELVYNR